MNLLKCVLLASLISSGYANAYLTPLLIQKEALQPISNCDLFLAYTYYEVCYSSEHRQAFWTFHQLSKGFIKGAQRRTNDFKKDERAHPIVKARDYSGSGYDRGHLVPAGDMKLNRQSMSESFYMTNMSPQNPSFNRGVWRSLESGLRNEVLRRGEAFIVTAPVLLSEVSYPRIRSEVSIPKTYYKIAYFPEDQLMLAFLIPNKSQKGVHYSTFQTSVQKIEDLTGYDFFSSLEDELEEQLENEIHPI